MKSLLVLFLSSLALLTAPAYAQSKKHDHHHHHAHAHQEEAHVHGLAELHIAIEGNALLMQLHTPAYNLIGFEHQPTTESEKQQLAQAVAMLNAIDTLFGLPADAGCVVQSTIIQSSLLETQAHAHGEHADFSAEYSLNCASPDALTHLDLSLTEHFPLMETIVVQSVSPAGQSRVELSAKQQRVTF